MVDVFGGMVYAIFILWRLLDVAAVGRRCVLLGHMLVGYVERVIL